MAKIYYSMLTDRGLELVAQAITTATKIGIEQFAVGDGDGAYYAPTGTETALRREKFRGNVQRLEVTGSRILIEAVIPTTSTGYTVREIGVFTATGEMVAIGNLPDIPKDAVTDGAIGELLVSMELQVTNTDVFELVVDSNTLLVTKPQLDAAIAGATSRLHTVILPAANWTEQADGSYTQTIPCEGITASVVTLPPYLQPSGDRTADIACREALGYISSMQTMDGEIKVTCWEDQPMVDLTVHLTEAR